jgi:integrase
MPLKLHPPRPNNPSWTIRGTHLGKYVERSSRTTKRALAVKVLRQIEREIERGEFSEPGEPTFASAAAAYMKAGGERTYLTKLLEHFGDTLLREIDQAAIDDAAARLYPNASSATRNRSAYTPISAVLRHSGITINLRRPKGSSGNKQTAWLWPEQAAALFEEAGKIDKEFATLLIVLCYTGMRLSEVLNLTWDRLKLTDEFAYVSDTKNNEPRAVFLPPVTVAVLTNHCQGVSTGRVFRFAKSGHLYSLLRKAAFKAGVDLPKRSAFHIFRHTYATWMRRYAGLDIKGLVATGAWKDPKSADRYSHVVVTEEARRAVMLPTLKRGLREIEQSEHPTIES